jgi:hypothetical protein
MDVLAIPPPLPHKKLFKSQFKKKELHKQMTMK